MPDPAARSPLAAAAEAHVAVVRKALRLDEADGRMTDAEAAEAMTAVVFSVTALRAAVAADAAWRARAEAAVVNDFPGDGQPEPRCHRRHARGSEDVMMQSQLRAEVLRYSASRPETWAVEAIDDDGGIERAMFDGPDAKARAIAYAEARYVSVKVR